VRKVSRDIIVELANKWLNTPYHHQAAVKGVGADCLGLIRGVYRELGGSAEEPPPYSPAWGEADDKELLLTAAATYLSPVKYSGWKAGDVLVFRVRNALSAKHCAIAIDATRMIHAVSERGVIVTNIGAWEHQLAGVFMFPGVE
jgi:NlpC/P60 family putative phage cell wall peptidase